MRRDRLEFDNSVFRALRPLLFEATEHLGLGKRREAEFVELQFSIGEALGTEKGIKQAAKAYKKAGLKTDYYNPAVHAAAFALPNWIKKLVP